MKKLFQIVVIMFLSVSAIAQVQSGTSAYKALNEKYTSNLFKNAEGTIFDVTNEHSASGYLNILDWLQGRVAGLEVYTSRSGTPIPFIRGSRAQVFVDEIPVDPGYLTMLPVSDIGMIKVFKTSFVGSTGNNGAIAIYRIQPDEEDEE